MPDCLSRHCRECNKLLTGGTVLIASGPTQSSTISLIIECGRLEPAGSGLRKDQVVTDNAVYHSEHSKQTKGRSTGRRS
jgi:hypothetical protein